MNKITGVSDGSSTIPVSWTLGVEETYWHNAIIMATTISRRIDTMNLWDGTLSFKEKVNGVSITGYNPSMCNIQDNFTTSFCENGYTFADVINGISIIGYEPSINTISAVLPAINNVSAWNTNNFTIVIKFDNPIYYNGDAVLGFTFTEFIGTTSNEIIPITVEKISLNKIQFTFSDFSLASQILVVYNNADGNVFDNVSGNLIDYFAYRFTPTMTYSEGE